MAMLIDFRMCDETYIAGGRVSIIRGLRNREVERVSYRAEGSTAPVVRGERDRLGCHALEGGDMGV